MRKSLVFLTIAILFACANPVKINKSTDADTPSSQNVAPKKAAIISGDDKDTINISTDDSDVFKYSRGELKRILKKDPELDADVPYPPDISWGESLKVSTDYDCEACRDDYYSLYAYFLRAKNGETKYREQRKKLIALYREINGLFGRLNGGGTYYGHQYARILGYAEYSICIFKDDDVYHFIRPYNVIKQKDIYLKSLERFIRDEVNNNPELSPVEKEKKKGELLGKVKTIGGLIATHFYLEMALKFQYSHY